MVSLLLHPRINQHRLSLVHGLSLVLKYYLPLGYLPNVDVVAHIIEVDLHANGLPTAD